MTATIQTEKYTLGIVESDGTPKTGALVELKIGASTYVLLELGTGKYQIASIPTGKYCVWIDSVNSGESVSVGSGQVPALGNEADAFLIGEVDNWKLGTITEVKTLLSLENVANIAIPDPTGNNGKVLSVSGDAYQLANFLDVSDKLDKIDPTAQSVVSEVTFEDTITLNTTAPDTPIKTLGRNASNEIIEFDNVVSGGQVDSVVGGTNVTIDNTDPVNPIINTTDTDLQTAYNNSTTPEILTDATKGALTIKRGSALDTDNVFEGKNGAGTTTSNITGEGGATFNDDVFVIGTGRYNNPSNSLKLAVGFNDANDSNISLYKGLARIGSVRCRTGAFSLVADAGNVLELDGDTINALSRILQGSVTDDTSTGIQADSIRSDGDIKADTFTLDGLNTAPSSASDTGTTGEVRWDANYMYVCTATDTWKRSSLATW